MTELSHLIMQVKEGNIDAFEPLVRRFQDMAVGYGYAILNDWQLAEDAAQEAFINAYLDLPSLNEPKAFPGWFRRIVFKQIDRIKRKRRPTVSLDQIAPLAQVSSREKNQPEPSERLEAEEVQDEILSAIQSLPMKQREVVTLHYISEYSYKEISAFLDIPISTIKMRLYHARKQLRGQLISLLADNLPEKRPSLNNTFMEKIMSFQIQVKEIPAQQVLSIHRKPLQKDLQAHLDGGIKTLIVYAQLEGKYGQSQDVQIVGLPFAIYHRRISTEDLAIEICLPVSGEIESTNEIEVKEMPAVDIAYASTTLRQSVYPGVEKAYDAIEEWIGTNNYLASGPPREIYLNYDHSIFSAAAKWEDPCLEIAWPYQKANADS